MQWGRVVFVAWLSSVVATGFGCASGETASVGDGTDASFDGSDDASGDVAPDTGPAKCTSDVDCVGNPGGGACDTSTGQCVGCVPTHDTCTAGTYCDAKTNKCVTGCKTNVDCASAAPSDAGALDAGDAASDAIPADAGADASSSDAGAEASTDASADGASEAGDDAGADAAPAPMVCDPQTHQCVGCYDSSQCPLGSLCDGTTNTCYPGCTTTHGCPGSFSCCGSVCMDLATSASDCGSCGKACAKVDNAVPACSASKCVIGSCLAGHADCNGNYDDGCEVDTNADPANCGTCGNVCSSANGTPACNSGKCGIACAPGWADCNGDPKDGCEVHTDTDTSHCGSCATACVVANDTPTCAGGKCGIASCDTGYGDCNLDPSDGCETNLNTSASSCGACNAPCSVANGTPACTSGACGIATCLPGYADCNKLYGDGCEKNLSTDPTNCGTCGTVCSVANGTPSCTSGSCTVGSCTAPYADCDKVVTNGCETNTQTNVANCGTCGNACSLANATPACNSGACAILSCNPGFGNCDTNVANGCETNTNTSTSNCGTCGHPCVIANGSPVCNSGSCAVASCNPGYADCNKQPADGCEVNLLNGNAANCGSCGNACSLANSSPVCVSGSCAIGACAGGYANCDGVTANGCEVNTTNSPANCGGCGHACYTANGLPACVNSVCETASCNPNYADCNGLPGDGCEVNTSTDVNNCGGCGSKCNLPNVATDVCVNSQCGVFKCAAGYADCDGVASNGCETQINGTDPNNCGGCNIKCSVTNGTPACSAGTCAVGSCNAGYANCDGSYANGCETNTNIDPTNCGTCGNSCATDCTGNVTATTCSGGACAITGCTSGNYNLDGTCSNGCECKDAGESQACSAPTSLGTLGVSSTSTVSRTGNLVLTGEVGYYTVTFTGNADIAYHPHVTLTSSTAGEFMFDVMADCNGTYLTCDVESQSPSTNRTEWEVLYTAGDPNSKFPNGTSNFAPIAPVGNAGTIIIAVHRAAMGAVGNCDSFTLTVSNL